MFVGSVLGKRGPGWEEKGEKWQFEEEECSWGRHGGARVAHDQGKRGAVWVRLCLGQRVDRCESVAEETPTSSGPRGTV